MEVCLYIHFPYCVAKCAYCDFDSGPLREYPVAYVEAVTAEIRARKDEAPEPSRAATLYFGGGTPSLLRPRDVERLVMAADNAYSLAPDAEVTLEVNPGTVDRERLGEFRRAGINRLSIGIQSLDDRFLQMLGRIHTAADGIRTVEAAREAGFDNIGIDLMHSLPGQTVKDWERTLARAVALEPEHVSAYALSVEEGTPFDDLVSTGRLTLPSEIEAEEMFLLTEGVLSSAGILRYEISNFARPGRESRHNSAYWLRKPYLGFGAGAHSLVGSGYGIRAHNVADPAEYIRAIAGGESADAGRAPVTELEAMEEFFFLGLRLSAGVSMGSFSELFGCSADSLFREALLSSEREGLLVREGDRIRLTSKGVILSNRVLARFIA